MEFNCGLTREECDRRDKEWHDFFPLLPRSVAIENNENICAWLQTIQRRATGIFYYDGRWVTWEYRRKPT